MDPTILPPSMDKLLGKLGSLTMVWKPVKKKEDSEIETY